MSDPAASSVPAIEWVFGCNAVLGSVASGTRNSRFNGNPVSYRPTSELGGGARWCSPGWLELGRGRRGFLARTQSGISRFCMHVSGQVNEGIVLALSEDQLERAVEVAESLVRPRHGSARLLDEWSMALIRHPDRTRLALRVSRPVYPEVIDEGLRILSDELPVEWLFEFRSGHMGSEPEIGRVLAPDLSLIAELPGTIYLEPEPLPHRLLELAEPHGHRDAGAVDSSVVPIDTGAFRPLEPDEWDPDTWEPDEDLRP